VPDVYRSAMAAVLEVAPPVTEQAKAQPHKGSRSSATTGDIQPLASGSQAAPNEIQVSASVPLGAGEAVETTPVAQAPTGVPTKEHGSRNGAHSKSKAATKEREKPVVVPTLGEDKATVEAKVRAGKALEARPGFASREDAIFWLHQTLDGDPALENLTAAYEQEVNAQLTSDADKLIDHSASIKRELARTQFKILPADWPGWKPTGQELPGLLVAVALLCLGAPFCFNMLKVVASLRPMPAVKREKFTSL
jgi:hypothetical protein